MLTGIQPVITENLFSVLMFRFISQEDVGNYRSETTRHLKIHALSMRAAVYPKATQASIKDDHIAKTPGPSPYHEAFFR